MAEVAVSVCVDGVEQPNLFQVVVTMSDVWRIFVVEGDEGLNQSLVNSLRKDGYAVQGVKGGVDAIRVLWSEAYDVVIYNLKTPGADGLELLQWLRAYRPSTYLIIVGEANAAELQLRALEGGAASYLEEPLDFRVLKEELRRLQQQTGFSASLDSFDLLDVIQVVTMSRKSIALLVNTGLEERGVLRFQNGELVWAEYGVLRGEEAFFALAAHKNGTVIHQPWQGQGSSNVTQPLSRLIFQALQYRTKYASRQQYSGEIEAVQVAPLSTAEIDDTPFLVLPPSQSPVPVAESEMREVISAPAGAEVQKEWWERTGQMASAHTPVSGSDYSRDANTLDALIKTAEANTFAQGHASITKQRADLPSWLTDQPTASDLPAIKSSSQPSLTSIPAIKSSSQPSLTSIPAMPILSAAPAPPVVPATPAIKTQTEEWNVRSDQVKTTDELLPGQPVHASNGVLIHQAKTLHPSSPEWNLTQASPVSTRRDGRGIIGDDSSKANSESLMPLDPQEASPLSSSGVIKVQQAGHRNYAVLVSALQTLGYTIAGFVAAAIVTIDGQPIAQVAVDEIDISKVCRYFSTVQKGVLLALDQGMWGGYEDMVITSAERYILMRMIGSEKNSFLVLMTTRSADPAEGLTVIKGVEETINQALH